jgi:hypothetical protein
LNSPGVAVIFLIGDDRYTIFMSDVDQALYGVNNVSVEVVDIHFSLH